MYKISLLDKIDYGATGIKAKLQNVRFILSTIQQDCCMDRNLGWLPNLDDPSEYVKSNMTAQIIEVIELNEPGVSVEEVTFIENTESFLSGRLIPVVKVVFEDADSEV